jgi:hypothetical protein
MKIRNGFVSNSSSSSFVALGAIVPRDLISKLDFCKRMGFVKEDCTEEDLEEEIENVDPKTGRNYYDILQDYFINDGESGAPDNKTIIGQVFIIDNEDMSYEIEFDLKSKTSEIKKILKKIGLEKEPLKLFFGTMLT